MSNIDTYIALVTSLPSSERLFAAKQPPLSRLRLERRLSALDPRDQARLEEIERLMSWRDYSMDDGNASGINRAKLALENLNNDTLQNIIMERLDLRTAIAALRMRRRNEAAPVGMWSHSRLTRHIIANWSDPTFKLDTRMPWLRQAATLMENQDPLGLERHVLRTTYDQLKRHGSNHYFDFEAVVIYVLKWNIFDRWARSDEHAATKRFETIAQEALGEFADLTLEGVS